MSRDNDWKISYDVIVGDTSEARDSQEFLAKRVSPDGETFIFPYMGRIVHDEVYPLVVDGRVIDVDLRVMSLLIGVLDGKIPVKYFLAVL